MQDRVKSQAANEKLKVAEPDANARVSNAVSTYQLVEKKNAHGPAPVRSGGRKVTASTPSPKP